jgi:hypothetical protein
LCHTRGPSTSSRCRGPAGRGRLVSVGVGRSIVVDHRRDRLVVVRCHSMGRDTAEPGTSSACHIAEEPLFLNTAHITPLGPLHDQRPGNGFTSHSVARHRVRRREVGTRVGQRAGVRSVAGTGGFRPGPAQSPPKTDMPTCRWPTPTEQPVFSTSRSTPTNSPEPSSPNSNKPYPQMFEKTCIANGSGNPRV